MESIVADGIGTKYRPDPHLNSTCSDSLRALRSARSSMLKQVMVVYSVYLTVVVAARVMDVIAMLTQQEIAQYQVAQD